MAVRGVVTLVSALHALRYGVVCAARDEDSNTLVAIKKIANAFEHTTYTKRTLREIRLLRLLQHEVGTHNNNNTNHTLSLTRACSCEAPRSSHMHGVIRA